MSDLPSVVVENPWQALRQLTPARIALGRTGTSLPTRAQLDFQLAHAQARDAVHLAFDPAQMAKQIEQRGRPVLQVHSQASSRQQYLQRPDLGRRLDAAAVTQLTEWTQQQLQQPDNIKPDIAVVIADGLSALAVQRHALPMLAEIEQLCHSHAWTLAPIVLASQARVALADEVGQLLGARLVLVMIGERPGLSSPDSLGLYMTWAPQVGLTDVARNCISNIRLEGMSYPMAAHRLGYLLGEAFQRQLSGVHLKDEATLQTLQGDGDQARIGRVLF